VEGVSSGILVTFDGNGGKRIRGYIPYQNMPGGDNAIDNPAFSEGRYVVASIIGYSSEYSAYLLTTEL